MSGRTGLRGSRTPFRFWMAIHVIAPTSCHKEPIAEPVEIHQGSLIDRFGEIQVSKGSLCPAADRTCQVKNCRRARSTRQDKGSQLRKIFRNQVHRVFKTRDIPGQNSRARSTSRLGKDRPKIKKAILNLHQLGAALGVFHLTPGQTEAGVQLIHIPNRKNPKGSFRGSLAAIESRCSVVARLRVDFHDFLVFRT